jgi:hypothetical protein
LLLLLNSLDMLFPSFFCLVFLACLLWLQSMWWSVSRGRLESGS